MRRQNSICKLFFLFAILNIISSCKNLQQSPYTKFFNYKWYNSAGALMIEDGCIHSRTHLDQTTFEMVGDTLIPLIILDSSIIITQIAGIGEVDDNLNFILKSDTLIKDTFLFEFMNITEPLLVLQRKYRDPWILKLKEPKAINETNHLNLRSFEIEGYTIGDSINRGIINIQDINDDEGFILEEAELASNEEIKFDIIGDNIIYSIERHNIDNDEIDNIIRVITEKLNSEPRHSDPTKMHGIENFSSESYSWYTYDVDIRLIRVIYEGDDPLRMIYTDENWILYYDNRILQPILSLVFGSEKAKSSIIE